MLDENIENASAEESIKKLDKKKKEISKKEPSTDTTEKVIKAEVQIPNNPDEQTEVVAVDNAVETEAMPKSVESISNEEDDLDTGISKEAEFEKKKAKNTEKPKKIEQAEMKSDEDEKKKELKIDKKPEKIEEPEVLSESVEAVKEVKDHIEKEPKKLEEPEVISDIDEEKKEVKIDDKEPQKVEDQDVISESTKEKNENKKKNELPNDFGILNLEEIVITLQQLLDDYQIHKIKTQFESLKSHFNKKYKILVSQKKEEFIKEGGNEIDFKFYLPIKSAFGDVLREYKKKRQKHYQDIETEQSLNLEKKLGLIEKLKNIIDTAEPATMYKTFRTLQEEWRSVGQIPHSKYNDVWRTYHHHVERFYDLLHLNNDLRDLDFKHNLEEKTKLIEKVEKLAEDADVNSAFKELQIIHRMWKEDIGPVGRDVREEVWKRFSDATKKIHHKRHEYQNQIEANLEKNIALKLAVVDKIKEIKTEGYQSHKMWQEGINKMESLRKEFFAIGRVPRSKNEEVWQVFKDATKSFNKTKNAFYKTIKKEQADNLERKMRLVVQAESLKDSEDWEMVTEVFKKIQADWKTIGHVPRRDSDRIWKRFKDACNHYFHQLHHMQDGHNKGQAEVFNKKKELLEKFKNDIDDKDLLNLDLVKEYMSNWKELGVVPSNLRHIDSKFNKALDNACKKLKISKEETEIIKFKNIIDGLLEQNDVRKIDNEQLFVRRKVDELTKEIKQLENNISFISNATDDNPLVKNVYNTIERYTKDLSIWKRKLSYIRSLDY